MSVGFGNADNYAIDHLLEYGGKLYAATWNEQTGGEIWRSADGNNWDWVVTGGFGDATNAAILCMQEFNGYLYAGTGKFAGGADVWVYPTYLPWQVNLPLVRRN
ncbi:MAG: hypothetical protein ACP5Q1_04065 [Anaerolineae bacterium]